jgi:phenylalanyl-tRNA synthetase beta chain
MCLKKIIKKLFGKQEATKFPLVVVGEVVELKKHPNADKLQLVKVDIGGKILDIVCGAWNMKVNDKVACALVGATLPNGVVLKEATIRGEKSFGMLCALDELGLGTDHSGIIILKSKAKVGKAIDEYLS